MTSIGAPDAPDDAPNGHWVTVADGPDAWIPDVPELAEP